MRRHEAYAQTIGETVMADTCETCRFWEGLRAGSNMLSGPCKRYPSPQPLKAATDWCGEHKPKGQFATKEVLEGALRDIAKGRRIYPAPYHKDESCLCNRCACPPGNLRERVKAALGETDEK